jgi:hypothetical protein
LATETSHSEKSRPTLLHWLIIPRFCRKIPNSQRFFKKEKRGRLEIIPNLFSKTGITLIPKPNKVTTRKRQPHTNILYEYISTNS